MNKMKVRFFLAGLLILVSILYLPAEAGVLSNEDLTVVYPSGYDKIAEIVAKGLKRSILDFQTRIGQYPDLPIGIEILSRDEDYLERVKSSQAIIEFSLACYLPREKKILVRDPKDQSNFKQLQKILLHEYIHHFIYHYWPDAPLWFHEGMAVYFTGDLDFDREWSFVRNYILGNTLQLREMRFQYPRNSLEWDSFYAKSGLAVRYLYQKQRSGFLKLWDAAFPERNFNLSFRKSFLMNTNDFSVLFEKYSKDHFTLEILLASSTFIWALLPLLLLLGWIRKQFLNYRIRKEWEMEADSTSEELEEQDLNSKMENKEP